MPRPDRLFDWRLAAPRQSLRAELWEGGSPLRLRLALIGFLAALVAIFLRAVQLEMVQGEAFREAAGRLGEQVDVLPARRGRIVSRDGQPLAMDAQALGVEVRYRWLEQPPNAAWLRRQARARLSPADRRRPQRVAEAEQKILAERDRMAQQLAELCGLSDAEWRRRAARIQTRVAAIAERANNARDERLRREREAQLAAWAEDETDGDESSATASADHANWWRRLAADLFSLDAPGAPERLVVAEERAYHRIVAEAPPAAIPAIRALLAAEKAGDARLVEHTWRVYPGGDSAANVLGYVASTTELPADDSDVPPSTANNGDAHNGDGRDPAKSSRANRAAGMRIAGVAGIERVAEATLRGQPGRRTHWANQRGKRLGVHETIAPVDGRDLRLTLDAQTQHAAEMLLDRALAGRSGSSEEAPNGGAVVVMDIRSGELLAAASAPRFDPNAFAHGDEQVAGCLSAPGQPMFDRVARMAIPPGSVFKIVTAIALLERQVVRPDTPYFCQGFLEEPDRMRCALFRRQGIGHGEVRLAEALAMSCNTYFFHFADSLGPEPLVAWAQRLGAGRATGSGLADEAPGRLATPASLERLSNRSWRAADTESLAIGQGVFTATPLQVATWIAAVGNGGYWVRPHILRSETRTSASVPARHEASLNSSQDPGELEHAGPHGQRLPISESTLAAIREGLRLAIDDPRGTGHEARRAWPTLAGKTGTAEVDGQPEHAWFASYTPADDPRWVIVVALEHGGSGAAAAGPIVRRLAEALDRLE